jgi:hypothetical protein
MTKALEHAFRVASSLPEAAQDALAAAILGGTLRREALAPDTPGQDDDALANLADEALADERLDAQGCSIQIRIDLRGKSPRSHDCRTESGSI